MGVVNLTAFTTEKELDSDAEKAQVDTAGLLINKFYRKSSRALGMAIAQGRNPTLVCINQIRYKIGVMYGNPETMPGGPSFKFASSMTIRLYGKDVMDKAVHAAMPAFKSVNFAIQKFKVPIVANNATDVKIATLPNAKLGLQPDDSYDWPVILSYLKKYELIVSGANGGWDVIDPITGEVENFKTQQAVKDRMDVDTEFDQFIRRAVTYVALQPDDEPISEPKDKS